MIGLRIKEERKKIQLNQTDFGKLAGASKRTLIDWEKDNSSPTAVQLNMLAAHGVDVLYVLTGERTDKGLEIIDRLNQAIAEADTEIEKAHLVIAREDEIAKQAVRKEKKVTRGAEVENYRNLLYELDDETYEEAKTVLNDLFGKTLLKKRLSDFKEKTGDNECREDDDKPQKNKQNIAANKINNVMGDNAKVNQGNVEF